MVETRWMVRSLRSSSLRSSFTSLSFCRGRITSLMPEPSRRQHLLLDPTDRQHAAGQRDLARHRQVAANGAARQLRRQRHRHGHARGRSVLRNGT